MNRTQSMTWELLLILGIVLLLVSPIGNWLGSIVEEMATGHKVNLSLNPFAKSETTPGGSDALTHGAMIPGNSGGGGGGTSLFNVPIVNSAGEPGTIQVVAHDSASAQNNAYQGGNTPTGSAVPA